VPPVVHGRLNAGSLPSVGHRHYSNGIPVDRNLHERIDAEAGRSPCKDADEVTTVGWEVDLLRGRSDGGEHHALGLALHEPALQLPVLDVVCGRLFAFDRPGEHHVGHSCGPRRVGPVDALVLAEPVEILPGDARQERM